MKSFYTLLSMAVICTLFLASSAIAMPQFAASTGQPCIYCHINPTGCWMRNTYGSQNFAQMTLPVHKISTEQISQFSPAISNNFSVGADIRTTYIYSNAKFDTLTFKRSLFFQMEANFYVDARLNDKFSISYYMDHASEGTKYQVWGMANILPFNGYIRAGRIQPSYGWRFADHTSFVRVGTFWGPTYSDVGMELGFNPTDISFNIGVFNGTDFFTEDNQGKAIAARLELRKNFDFLGGAIGGSYWHNDSAAISLYGPFYYVTLFDGKLTYLGEIDWLKSMHSDSLKLFTTHILNVMPTQGIWLSATYDFQDPNTKVKSGSTSRYGGGLNIFPIAFLEIEPMIRYYRYDLGPGIPKDHTTEYQMKFHFFF